MTAVLDHDPTLTVDRPGLTIIADKGYVSSELDTYLAERGVALQSLLPQPHPAHR